jgi:hypothetical protein
MWCEAFRVARGEAAAHEGSEEEVSDQPIKHGLNELVALCIEYEVRKPGMAAAIAKIIDDCTDNRDVQIALLTRDLAAANATVEERPIVGTTGDGVSVRVGQPIYRATPTHIETGYAQADGSVGGPKMWACSVGMYYSTRTTAESACEGKENT